MSSSVLATVDQDRILGKIKTKTVPFISNQGQFNKDVLFYTGTLNGTLFVTHRAELVYNLPKTSLDPFSRKEGNVSGVVLKEYLVNAKLGTIKGSRKAAVAVNYFRGKDRKKWRSRISTFEEISMGEVYKGIEFRLKAYSDNVEKIFHIAPGADPDLIRIGVAGGDSLKVIGKGELQISTRLGDIHFTRPIAWQVIDGKRIPVKVAYNVASNSNPLSYSFQVGSYENSSSLFIDPLLASTFSGGANSGSGNSIILDSTGNVYVTGSSGSADYPTTTGAYNTTLNGGTSVVISKFSPDLRTLLASTFIGGSNYDAATSIKLDSTGNVYVTGRSNSADYPTTAGAYDEIFNGGIRDIVVSKLTSDLSTLLASTYLGGQAEDTSLSITLDSSDNVYLTGNSSSGDYPTTEGAYDRINDGSHDVVISKLSSDLSTLLASTFIGGASGSDSGNALAFDSIGNVYVTGDSMAYYFNDPNDYPTTAGAYDKTFNAQFPSFNDLIVSKLSSDLTSLLASTFVGSSGGDCGNAITLDSTGNVYVTGSSNSFDYPTTSGAYDEMHNGKIFTGGSDLFDDLIISKLSPDLSTLLASTFLGGIGPDSGNSIALDSTGNVYVTGLSGSSTYPVISRGYSEIHNSLNDIVLSKLSPDLDTLLASTFLGGNADDEGNSIAFDGSGNVYVTGKSNSPDYPTTAGAYDEAYNGAGGEYDLIVSKLTSDLSSSSPAMPWLWLLLTNKKQEK